MPRRCLVPVAGGRRVDVVARCEARRLVEAAGRDRDRRATSIPEETRAADGAEAAPRTAMLVPAQAGVRREVEPVARAGRVRRRAAVRPPADGAVADDHIAQWTGDAVADGVAEAPAQMLLGHGRRVERQAARRSTARRRFIAWSAATLYDSARVGS